MNENIIIALAGAITTIVSGFVSWFFAKRKYNAEVDSSLIENMQNSLEFYKSLADDNKARLEEVLLENASQRKEIAELRRQLDTLTSTLAQYGIRRLMEENHVSEKDDEQA